ncbi:acetyltransferase [Lasiosphaeria miniovina]|uniref:Acetyltransferase n=1 Tax=Lasiosphaeria miniovina TaxID=1954250 RepID=A0AA40AUI2_9PEZI|nr:acetyltransferase [Lasiosphaeria miniovina]KAK0722174.1 acetyltransferase [Lasiosphaeria miniovina]
METVSSTSSNSTVTLVELKRSLVPPKWEDGVRVVGMSECREAALTLAHAFAADDYAQYLADPGDMDDISAEDKWKLHLDITTYTVAAGCLEGLVTTVGPDYDSVALWVPPGKELDGWVVTLRSGLWRLYFQLSAEGRKRYFDEILPLLHETKTGVLGDRDADAWYLVNLGTKPNSQGRGYAQRLLEDMFHKVDAEDRPIYLESSSQANNTYYEKFGFEVKREISLTRGNAPVRLWIMVREPRPARKVAYHHHHQSPTSPMMMKTKKFHIGAGAVAGVKM